MVEIQAQSEDDSLQTVTLVPSFVYFPKDNSQVPIVGPKARAMFKTQPSRVVKSIKSKMGVKESSQFPTIDGIQHNPVEISGLILKQMMGGIQKLFPGEKDIVLTVPASFDSDMRDDTIKAAQEASIKLKNTNGTAREILLDEPRATLFDFVYQQRTGTIPRSVIDFSTKKTVLIYDLGGGTLDVSIHEVYFEKPEDIIPNITDFAISRYNKLGGDNFDEILADFLYQRYLDDNGLSEKNYSALEIVDVKMKLLHEAESFKQRISKQANLRRSQDPQLDIYKLSEKITSSILYEMYPLSITLSLKDYKQILRPLFADDLAFPKKGDITTKIEGTNLIVPIIDTLRKAYKKTNRLIMPDFIILTGGMVHVPLIQERIEKFFGKPVFLMLDPDESVARGAAVYHYYLHHGFTPNVILAESILVGVQRGEKEELLEIVEAGQVLPYSSKELTFIVPDNNLDALWIPFYRSDKSNPLTHRKFTFSKKPKKNSEITAQAVVDREKILSFKAWLKDDPSQSIEVTVDPTKAGESRPTPMTKVMESKKAQKISTKPAVKPDEKPVVAIPRKKIDPLLFDRVFKNIKGNTFPDWRPNSELDILNAKNLDELIKHSLKLFGKDSPLGGYAKGRLTILLGNVAATGYAHKNFPEAVDLLQNKIIAFINQSRNLEDLKSTDINTRIRFSVEALGKIGIIDKNRDVIKLLIGILNELVFVSIADSILNSMGKLPPDIEIIDTLKKYFPKKATSKGTKLKSMWAIGKQGQRDASRPLQIDRLRSFIPIIKDLLSNEKDYNLIHYAIYALCELCNPDPSPAGGNVTKDEREAVLKELQKIRGNPSLWKVTGSRKIANMEIAKRWVDFGINWLSGVQMTDEERIMLMGIREEGLPKEEIGEE